MISDLYEVMVSCCQGRLSEQDVTFDSSQSAVAVVLVSGGYPDHYRKGMPITGEL